MASNKSSFIYMNQVAPAACVSERPVSQ